MRRWKDASSRLAEIRKNPSTKARSGAWLFGILFDEALLILVERKRDLTTSSEQVLSE